MADEGDSSSEGEKSEQRDELELQSSNSDVCSVFGNFFVSFV